MAPSCLTGWIAPQQKTGRNPRSSPPLTDCAAQATHFDATLMLINMKVQLGCATAQSEFSCLRVIWPSGPHRAYLGADRGTSMLFGDADSLIGRWINHVGPPRQQALGGPAW